MDATATPIAPTLHGAVVRAARCFGLTLGELTGPKRNRSTSRRRMAAMAVVRELTDASYPEIGLAFGGRDHTTVMNACRRAAVVPQIADFAQKLRPVLAEYLAGSEEP